MAARIVSAHTLLIPAPKHQACVALKSGNYRQASEVDAVAGNDAHHVQMIGYKRCLVTLTLCFNSSLEAEI